MRAFGKVLARLRAWASKPDASWARGGYTLVEVLMASVVFAVGTLGALALFSTGTILLNVENHRRTAAEIAYSRQEELRTVSFAALPTHEESDAAVAVDDLSGARDTVVEDVDEDEDGNLDYRRVTVNVTWWENGRNQEVELVTLRSRYR